MKRRRAHNIHFNVIPGQTGIYINDFMDPCFPLQDKRRDDKGNFGQTLIELLMALGAGVLIVLAIVGGLIMAGKNSQFAKNQNLATRYAQEGVEFIRSQRDKLGWSVFKTNYSGQPQCISSNGSFTALANGCSKIANIFTRSATFIDDGTGLSLTVAVTVSWSDSSGLHSSSQTTVLTSWQ